MATQYIPSAPGDATHAVTVVPSDTTIFSPPLSQLYVGVAGDLSILMMGDTVPVLLKAAPLGMLSGMLIQKVMTTGTAATTMVGFR